MELREHWDHSEYGEEIGKNHHQHVADRGGESAAVHPINDREEQGTSDNMYSEDSHQEGWEEIEGSKSHDASTGSQGTVTSHRVWPRDDVRPIDRQEGTDTKHWLFVLQVLPHYGIAGNITHWRIKYSGHKTVCSYATILWRYMLKSNSWTLFKCLKIGTQSVYSGTAYSSTSKVPNTIKDII